MGNKTQALINAKVAIEDFLEADLFGETSSPGTEMWVELVDQKIDKLEQALEKIDAAL